MNSQLERAADALFPSEGSSALNIKFFGGYNRVVTAEQLADQYQRATSQIEAGDAELVANIDGDVCA